MSERHLPYCEINDGMHGGWYCSCGADPDNMRPQEKKPTPPTEAYLRARAELEERGDW